MNKMSVEVLVKNSCSTTGEGPHWDEGSKALYYVDITSGDVHKYDTITNTDTKYHFDADVSFVIPRTKGGFAISNSRKIVLTDDDFNPTEDVCEVEHGQTTRFNDAKCDGTGRIWAGTMGMERAPAVLDPGQGSLYSLDQNKLLKKWVDKIDISNGLAWNSADDTMFFIDSIPRKVYAFDYDAQAGSIKNQRVAVDFGSKETFEDLGVPDGMAIDVNDKLWVATYFGGKVVQFDPETGKELRRIEIPARRVTSCCFGGPNYETLYVTCSRVGMSEEELKKYPLAGSVFKVTGLGAKGLPPVNYAG